MAHGCSDQAFRNAPPQRQPPRRKSPFGRDRHLRWLWAARASQHGGLAITVPCVQHHQRSSM